MVSRLEEELPDAAMLVYVTNSEGLGSGAMLAMSAAVPVIASNVGGLPEVIRHGENGLLVENDEAAIAGAIRQLLEHPEQARQIGAAARRTDHRAIHRGPHGGGHPGSLPPGTRVTLTICSIGKTRPARVIIMLAPQQRSGDPVIDALIAFVFGLLIGSFLNVCIHRWPRNRSVVKPRSHCVRCRKPIAWYDNIPLVSYVVLGGRCRHCGASISLRYPLVEFLTGNLFLLRGEHAGAHADGGQDVRLLRHRHRADLLRSGKAHPAR